MRKKITLIIVIISCLPFKGNSQDITLNQLITYINKDVNLIAETLMDKGYQFAGNPKSSSFYKGGDGIQSFSIDIEREYTNYVQLCWTNKYETAISKIVGNVKNSSVKTKTFFSPWFKIYITEYVYKQNTYIYLGQGICFTDEYKSMKFIILSNMNIRESLFSYTE